MKRISSRLSPAALSPWVQRELAALKAEGVYASQWSHENGPGFGLVLVDVGSGELHVLADGTVSRHVEVSMKVVLSTSTVVYTEEEFFKLYQEFKARICEWPPRSNTSA